MSRIVLNLRWTSRTALYCMMVLSSMLALRCCLSRTEELCGQDKEMVSSDESLSDSTLNVLRTAVINNLGQLSNEEKKTILERAPQVGRYKLSGEFKQYKWRWDLPTGRSILVSFTGFIENIDVDELKIAVIVNKK